MAINDQEEFLKQQRAAMAVIDEVKKAVKGKSEIIRLVLLSILSRGHILLEDIPGVGKTTLAIAFSKALELHYNRVQFTPDVMPSDVTGYTVYRKDSDKFEYVKGAALCNLFLADEINRTSSKTQSALLEVMEEGKVTVDMKTYEAPKPFIVIATQNPMGYAGTQMLPESQLDRFLVRLSMGYPDKRSELMILRGKSGGAEAATTHVSQVMGAEQLMLLQDIVDEIYIHDSMYEYIVSLAAATRSHELIELGASPRGAIALMRLSKASAFLNGRDYVLSQDVKDVAVAALSHRLMLKPRVRTSGETAEGIIKKLIDTLPSPMLRADTGRGQ